MSCCRASLTSEKKIKNLEEGIIKIYDKPGCPSAATIYPNLWDNIHDCVEFWGSICKMKKECD